MSLLQTTQQTPPDSPRYTSRATMGPPERESNRAVDAVVGALRNLTSDDNYKIFSEALRDVQDLRTENARLATSSRDTFEEYRKFRNELEAAEAKLRDEKTQLEQSIEQKDSQIHGLESDKANLNAEVDEGRRRLEDESNKCSELAEKRDELEKAVTELETILDDKSKLLAELEEAKSKLDVELTEATESLDSKTKEHSDLEAAKAEVESQLTETRTSLDDKTKELASSEETKTTLEGQLAEISTKLDDKAKEAEELAAHEQALTTELAETNSKLSDKEKEFDELSEAKTSLESQLTEETKKLEETVQNLDNLSEAKEKLEVDLADISAKLEDKSKEAEDLTSQLTEANTKLDERTKEAEELTTQLTDLNASLEAKSAEISELSTAKEAVDAKLVEVNDQLTAEQEAKMAVEEELQATREQLQQEKDRTSVLTDEVAHLHETLQDRNKEIENLQGEVTQGKDNCDKAQFTIKELQGITDGLEKELKDKASRLDAIDGYQVKLQDEPEDSCVEILDTIWVSILDLAEKHFSADLDAAVLRDQSAWSNLRNSEYLKNAVRIPLPQSNSPAAKQMRIAAMLAVLSRSLAKHIFRPSYIVDNDAELAKVLRDLEAVNPAQELHARATLLAVLPERERRSASRRVKAVVREASYLVQHLLSALQYEAFCAALEESCELACRQWRRIRGAAMKIEPYFGPPYDDFDWQVMLLPERFGAGAGGVNGILSSGSTLGLDAGSSTIGGGARLQDSGLGDEEGSSTTAAESIRSVVDPVDIMLVLWPTMCAVEGGELVSITQGLVMAKDQANAAFDEEGRRRLTHHKRARSMSQSRNSVAGSPRSAKPFLAHAKTEGDGGGASASRSGSVYDDRD